MPGLAGSATHSRGTIFARQTGLESLSSAVYSKSLLTKNKSDHRQVQAHIDEGVPLLWSVMLGLTKEPGIPQTASGHMRLIIGYNTAKEETLCSAPSVDALAIFEARPSGPVRPRISTG